MAVSFDPLPGIRTVQLGLLWQSKFRHRFPRVEEQPPIEPAVENFERKRQEFSVSFETGPIMPRLWFLDSAGVELVQVQRNWFARN